MLERNYWLAFAIVPGIGPKKFRLLLNAFSTAETAWNAGEKDIAAILGNALGKNFLEFRQTFDSGGYLEQLKRKSVWFVTPKENDYPERLKEVDNAPFVLFGKGSKKILNRVQDDRDIVGSTPGVDARMVAVVGTRKVTSYGKQVTEMITTDLVRAGCIVISGLALGVDATAHQTTLENNGNTIAVLGCGVDRCYPSANEKIYHEILNSGGAVISEYPLGMSPSVGSFPSRNRIIAGMSEAVVVTEGAEDSGSLITANDALNLGRKVFAIPGPITSHLSNGPMKLIRKGAVLVTSGEEIMQNLGITSSTGATDIPREIKGETKEEQIIIDLLQNESLTFDELVKKSGGSAATTGTLLSYMELKGYVTLLGDQVTLCR